MMANRLINKLSYGFILLLSGCALNNSAWNLDRIASHDTSYSLSKLSFNKENSNSPLGFELTQMGDQVESFLTLSRFYFPDKKSTTISFHIENESFEEEAKIHKGRMKIKLSKETTTRLIQALQNGKKIVILLDSFEQVLEQGSFKRLYEQFKGK